MTAKKVKEREPRDFQADEFVLRDKLDLLQEDVENWIIATGDAYEGVPDELRGSLRIFARVTFESALRANWFNEHPDMEPGDIKRMSPPVVVEVGAKITALWEDVNSPDKNFTEVVPEPSTETKAQNPPPN